MILRIVILGPIKGIKIKFWLAVFEAWKELNLKRKVASVIDVLCSHLWSNNIKVGNDTVYYKDWIEKGIWTVYDLFTAEEEFIFSIFQGNFLNKLYFLTLLWIGIVCLKLSEITRCRLYYWTIKSTKISAF